MRCFLGVILVVAMAGCNATDSSELARDAKKLTSTATRSAGNAQLAGRVKLQLSQTKGVEMTGIKVEAKGGVVTLKGSVRNLKEKQTISRVVKEIRGVDKLVNELRIASK